MELTGPLLQWGTAALAVLATVLVVAGWARLARRGPVAVLARSAALAAVNGLVLLAVLVTANDEFSFYSDYADLLGRTGPTTVVRTGAVVGTGVSTGVGTGVGGAAAAPSTAAPTAPRSPAAPASPPAPVDRGVPVPGTAGRLERLSVAGASGTAGHALVLLPAGYADPANAGRTYPVIEAFHGYPGTPQQWLGAMGVQQAVDAAVAAHHLAPTLVVIPDLEVPPVRDSECLDAPAGQPRMEQWLTSDVPHAVQASYRVRTAASSWATTGLSMGGWCAAMATVLHPQQYGAALVFGGYFRYDPGAWRPFAPGSPAAHRLDLVALARTAPPAVAVWATTSRTDPLSYPSTAAFAAAARAPLSVTAVVQTRGGHRMDVWAPQEGAALAWLGRTEAGFAPTG